LLQSGMSELDMLTLASQMSPQLQAIVENVIRWLYRRHQEHYILEHVVEHVETALEDAGFVRERAARPPAMVFLDLAGYTRLTEERGDDAAAELAASLARLVQGESRRFGGRPVKWLGDGVMFHFPDPGPGVLAALDMLEGIVDAGLPPAHVGVHAGPVVLQDGDYYGHTVIMASRIADYARQGEVLVTDAVREASSGLNLSFSDIGAVELKGVAGVVRLHAARRAG